MAKILSIPVLAIFIAVCLCGTLRAQNPPMNCTPDGIIEVCTLVDTNAAQNAIIPVAPPAPHVTYKNGQLTIVAENVHLIDVLHEVSRKTGATIDVPAGSAAEPVFANIGPGPVRDVLAALLNGSRFNYVIAGSANKTSGLDSVVLTPAQRSSEVAQGSEPDVQGGDLAASSPQAVKAPGRFAAQDQSAEQQAAAEKAAEVDRAREEAMQSMAHDREEQTKQGSSQAPDSANQN